MKSVQLLAALCVLGSASVVKADIFLNFEDLPTTYNADYGGSDILGNYSPYVSFGQNVQGTGGSTFYPVIGNVGIVNLYDGLFVPTGPATINFQLTGALVGPGAGVTGLSFWYSSLNNLMVSVYDSANTLISTGTALSNSTGYSASSGPSYFSIAAAGADHVVIDDGSGFGGNFVVDDLNINSSNVPDSSSTLGLLGLAGASLLAFRRKVATA